MNQDKHDADHDGGDGDHAQDPPEGSSLCEEPLSRAHMASWRDFRHRGGRKQLMWQGRENWPGALSAGLVGGTRRDHRTVGAAEDVEGDDAQQENAEQRGECSPFVRPIGMAKSVARVPV
ncbi:MAG TPA: hypothetical protein VFB88_01795 [Xanthobacteraceae bacterium]|nr:hypothetical protein [Xanthobacteraceae bacterium]